MVLLIAVFGVTFVPSIEVGPMAQPPDTPNPNTWVPNGPVHAIASSGSIVYIGGDFSYVGPKTGYGASISASTGRPLLPYSKVNSDIRAVIQDGFGGWYIAGSLRVGDAERNRIAHILSDGTLDPSWNPNANGDVFSLAVSGGTVYAGGLFTNIGGQARSHICCT